MCEKRYTIVSIYGFKRLGRAMKRKIWHFILAGLLISSVLPGPARSEGEWLGHDFAFCFVTDDGTKCNLAFADTASVMDFRFTIAVNVSCTVPSWSRLSRSEIHNLWESGFEIAQHSASHANRGLSLECPQPPRVSLMAEVERDTITTWTEVPVADIRVVAYPRHLHGHELIEELMAEGFIGARTGGKWDYENNSAGEFTTMAKNSWDDGISLYRIPIANSAAYLFGDHSASPPVHGDYESFRTIAERVITPFQETGGICVIYTHHLGDDDDTYGDINYGSGGMTKQDLAWAVDFAREKNGIVMTLGDAIAYYRARSVMEEIDDDLVWRPTTAAVVPPTNPILDKVTVFPNPFNPVTGVSFLLSVQSQVSIGVFDLRGRRVATLAERTLAPGHHLVPWNARNLGGETVSAGTYVVRIQAGVKTVSRLVSLIK
ncbi:MAG: T9SS type A sorting domain-containing protein [Candidatus Krumholzibacteria bacterium]|nr:T9SS type A sorting domain-containing protein [Candidatus Krumholzibacteria bacterium]